MAAKGLAKAQREGARELAAKVNELKRLIDELQVRGMRFTTRHRKTSLFSVLATTD